MARATGQREKACFTGSFHSNIPVESKTVNGSQTTRLWKGAQKGFVSLDSMQSRKGDSLSRGISVTAFPSGNFHRLCVPRNKEFFVMRKFSANPRFSHLYLDDNAKTPRLYQINTGYFTDSSIGEACERPWYATANILQDGTGAIIIPITGLDKMSDHDILAAVKGCSRQAKVAEMEASIIFTREHVTLLDEMQPYPLEHLHFYYFNQKQELSNFRHLSDIINAEYQDLLEIWEGRNKEAGWIYLLSDQLGHYKIGRTSNLNSRIKQLGTQPPFKIKLLCAFRAVNMSYFEEYLHENYEEYRMNGEWFSLSDEQVQNFIAKYGGNNYLTEDSLSDSPLNKQKVLKGGYDY